jgi:DNA gyrase subunit A
LINLRNDDSIAAVAKVSASPEDENVPVEEAEGAEQVEDNKE